MTLADLEELKLCRQDADYWRGGMSGPESRYTDVGTKLWPALLAVAKAAEAFLECDDDAERMALRAATEQMRAALK